MIRNTLCLLFCLLVALKLDGQQLPYYVVVGAYAVEGNAQRAALHAHSLNYPAVYGFNSEKKFFYVYVRVSSERQKALGTLNDIRKDGFRDAWIFHGSLNLSAPNPVAANDLKKDSQVPLKAVIAEPDPSQQQVTVTASDIQAINQDILKSDSTVAEETATKAVKPAGRGFVFKLFNEVTGNPVTGIVRLQESDRANQFRPFVANNLVYVTAPSNKNGRWVLVCNVIGFKPLKTFFNYREVDAIEGITVGNEQEIILPVPLQRVKRGDYIEMDEVRFQGNSNIMTPESERELKELLAMMNENEDYKIRLHGHTNGTQSRDIVSLGESTNLFHTNTSNKKHGGSAKELSTLRAEAVKLYLVNNGIREDRIAVKGEGGVQMIYDPKGTLGAMNDRVEVEVTKH
jgi:outer membrane protein OmpA-like peptidoglycan-associated protein